MKRADYIYLFLVALLVAAIVASFEAAPGYMDADYYLAGAIRLAEGHGFSEIVLWNYLDDPAGLPHPSHGYWMPLTSIVAWVGLKAFGFLSAFRAAQFPFVFLAALVSPLTAALAWRLTARRELGLLSGVFAAFSGFYLPFLITTDAFGIYMVLGAAFLLIIDNSQLVISNSQLVIAGILAGLMHLARADGIIWLLVAISFQLLAISNKQLPITNYQLLFRNIVLVLLGYLLFTAPWFARNQAVFGSLLAPGGSRTLWMLDYDELFSYPASLLTFERWRAAGLGAAMQARLWALGQNLQTALAVQGTIFLAPLIVVGGWKLRKNLTLRLGTVGWLLTLIVMTVIFPFSGARGGFFHSGAALMPLAWALAAVGLDAAVAWAGTRRRWNLRQAQAFFRVGAALLAAGLTFLVVQQRVIGAVSNNPVWGQSEAHYEALEAALAEMGTARDDVVLVNNPPGFYLAGGRAAIVIPNGGVDTLLAVAERYGARYVLLETNHPHGLNDLYEDPRNLPGLRYLGEVDGTYIFEYQVDE